MLGVPTFVAHAMLRTAITSWLRERSIAIPVDYDERRRAHQTTRRAVEFLEPQGYRVTVEPEAGARRPLNEDFLSGATETT